MAVMTTTTPRTPRELLSDVIAWEDERARAILAGDTRRERRANIWLARKRDALA